MKKILLTTVAFALFAMSGMALMPTRAEAFPAFARQTGASCLSCHFQTFPALTPFGRSFMMNSFTDVGDQALIEDDNLSIPAVLNASFDVRANFTNVNAQGVGSVGTFNIPAEETRLFLAGRIGANSGAIIVFDPSKPAKMNAGPAPVWMFLNSMDLGDFKLGLGAQKSPWGGSNVMEVSNVFGHRGDKLGGQDISGISNAGFTKMTSSIGAWAGNNDIGYVQLAVVAPAIATLGNTNVGLNLGKLIRVVGIFDLAGWDTLVGFGNVSGRAGKATTAAQTAATGITGARIPMNLQFVDFQMQNSDVGGMSIGIYADYAHAKGQTSVFGTGNFYGDALGPNLNGNKFDAYSARIEVEPVNRVILGFGYGFQRLSTPAPGNVTNRILHLAGVYKFYQNMDLTVIFDDEKFKPAMGITETTRTTTVILEALM